MKYCFSKQTIEAWLNKLNDEAPTYASFEQFVQDDKQVLVKQRLKRIDELIDNLIDSMKNSSGKFELSAGFDRECGTKGGKLSGGQK